MLRVDVLLGQARPTWMLNGVVRLFLGDWLFIFQRATNKYERASSHPLWQNSFYIILSPAHAVVVTTEYAIEKKLSRNKNERNKNKMSLR